jgi:hypothetical protein
MQAIEIRPVPAAARRLQSRQIAVGSLCACVMFVAAASVCAAGQSDANAAAVPIPSDVIVQRMVEQNALRAQHLKYFTSQRHYHIEFHGLGRAMSADMHAQVTYTAGSGKTFQVIDESGSHLLLEHVLKKLLQTEQDDSHQKTTALSPDNYNFTFRSAAIENGRPVYVFTVAPKVKNKLLYHGDISIDAADYALVRVDAQPAENPSFWIKSTEIHSSYQKRGEFWLPDTNESESKTRLGGTASLRIDYGSYQFQEPHDASPSEASE